MLQPLPLRPPCPIPEDISCRFRVQGRCCHAGFVDRCPISSVIAAYRASAESAEWLNLGRGTDEEVLLPANGRREPAAAASC